MEIRSFEGDTLREAVKHVEKAFGKDATLIKVIYPKNTLMSKLFGKQKFVVVASDAPVASKRQPQRARPVSTVPKPYAEAALSIAKEKAVLPESRCEHQYDKPCTSTAHMKDIKEQLARMEACVKGKAMPEKLSQSYLSLLSNCVSEKMATEIVTNLQNKLSVKELSDSESVDAAIREIISSHIKTSGDIKVNPRRQKRIIFIGPTGVGKTTTIAKITSHLVFHENVKVGVMTSDIFRIAAAEQLKRIIDIVKIPFEKFDHEDPDSVANALNRMKGCEVVLVDTAGRSPNDKNKMNELRNILDIVKPDEVHLVMSVTSNLDAIERQIEMFSKFDVDQVVLTKLDEATKFGLILDIVHRVKAKLSYITDGQIIPCDIRPADSADITSLIMGGHLARSG